MVEITSCLILIWMLAFLGGAFRVILQPNLYGNSSVLWALGYGGMAFFCAYGAILLFKRSFLGNLLTHIVLLFTLGCAWAEVGISSVLKVPVLVMGTIGVLLLFFSRRDFTLKRFV